MRSYYRIPAISILVLLIWSCSTDQGQIQYGSNNGQYIAIRGTRIYYEEYGEGIPLLLLHGGYMSISYYGMAIPELSNHFRVIALDSPGHGRSEQADTISFQLMADYVSEMIDLLGFDSVYVLGCSAGGTVAMLLAHDRPDKVKRIISDGGVTSAEGCEPELMDWMESITPETMDEEWVEEYISMNPQADQWEKFIIDTQKMWVTFPWIPDSKIANIKSRALIVMGDRDPYITLEHGLELYRAIPGSEFCVVPDAGHCICDEKPYQMNDIVIDFLTKE